MHDLIYDHQNDWKEQFDVRPIFEGYAKQIGLDVERYKRDVNGELVAQRIFQDGKRGHSMGVKGTPTVFINGREVPFEYLPADKLRVVIQNELAARSPEMKKLLHYVAAAVLSLLGLADALYLTVEHVTGQSVRCTILRVFGSTQQSVMRWWPAFRWRQIGAAAYFTVFSLATLAAFGYRIAGTF